MGKQSIFVPRKGVVARLPEVTLPEDFSFFHTRVALAKLRQHGSLTTAQFNLLRTRFIAIQPLPEAGLLMSWYHQHTTRLQTALAAAGVTVRPAPVRRLHRYALTGTGLKRLGEIERKIAVANVKS